MVIFNHDLYRKNWRISKKLNSYSFTLKKAELIIQPFLIFKK